LLHVLHRHCCCFLVGWGEDRLDFARDGSFVAINVESGSGVNQSLEAFVGVAGLRGGFLVGFGHGIDTGLFDGEYHGFCGVGE
jgi:hypothetical protein